MQLIAISSLIRQSLKSFVVRSLHIKEIFRKIGNEKIKKRFEEMKNRRMLLPKKLMVSSVLFEVIIWRFIYV